VIKLYKPTQVIIVFEY